MFVIDLVYTAPLTEIDAHMKAHMKYLNKYYDKEIFLVSGRKIPRSGGIILASKTTLKELEGIITEDPFISLNLATATITEFSASQHQSLLESLI